MQSKFNEFEQEKVAHLRTVLTQNRTIQTCLADYLNRTPRAITAELLASMNLRNFCSEEIVYCSLLTSFCGLNPSSNESDDFLYKRYFRPGVRKSDPSSYSADPYRCDIVIPEVSFDSWNLAYESYTPYEAFIRCGLLVKEDFCAIPQIGFFSEEFRYPAVYEQGREWMTVKPNEIETMKDPLDKIRGRVAVFGLGLGYFAYLASLKGEVERVTVIERDERVIELFNRYIFPQFRTRTKIEVVTMDAFDYLDSGSMEGQFEYSFFDLWHDESDGLDLYLKLRQKESTFPKIRFLYWIEETLLASFRQRMFETLLRNASSFSELIFQLSGFRGRMSDFQISHF